MRSHGIVLTAAVSLLVLGCGGGDPSARPGMPSLEEAGAETESSVVIEAEAFAKWGGRIEPPMRVSTDEEFDEKASKGHYIIIDGDAGKPGAPKPGTEEVYPPRWGAVSYTFTVAKAGKYRFWGRKLYEDGCGNSFTLVVNGGAPTEFADQTTGKWHWHACSILFDLKVGENTLEILNREDGVKLDQFLLTKKLNFIPVEAE